MAPHPKERTWVKVKVKTVPVIFSEHHAIKAYWGSGGSGANPASYSGYREPFPQGVKRPGHEADHLSPSSAEVKNAWSYTSHPPYAYMAWYLVQHRDKFALPYSCISVLELFGLIFILRDLPPFVTQRVITSVH